MMKKSVISDAPMKSWRTTMGLPLEVFCEILLWVSQTLPLSGFSQRVLAYQALRLVCRDWNAAVEGEKRLWTYCDITVELEDFSDVTPPPPGYPTHDREIELEALKAFSRRSGNLPLELEIINSGDETGEDGTQDYLFQFILSWGHRWHRLNLDLSGAASSFLNYAGSTIQMVGNTPFQNVQHLTLSYIGWDHFSDTSNYPFRKPTSNYPFGKMFPVLKTLGIHTHDLINSRSLPNQLALLASTLESLELKISWEWHTDSEDLDACRIRLHEILTRAPSLKYLRVRYPTLQHSPSLTTHNQLQTLVIDNARIALDELATLCLPALKTLIVDDCFWPIVRYPSDKEPFSIEESLVAAVTQLVEKSQCRLDVLRLPCNQGHGEIVEELRESLGSLRLFVLVKHPPELSREKASVQLVVRDMNVYSLDPEVRKPALKGVDPRSYSAQ
ncbi:hypothetical protein BKA70DRAFT_1259223 [Coprinopsis sp. MPI-PUGE-AT-0042]|nr:hypothetical protein BKA70DRAFT_1259223 [Coprinopsis sp. MPI-PUGE-AT-0042]